MGNSSAISELPIHNMNGQGTLPCCLTLCGKDIIKINQLPTIVLKVHFLPMTTQHLNLATKEISPAMYLTYLFFSECDSNTTSSGSDLSAK